MNSKGYWVTAIAARPSSTHKGYLLGGLVWFAVPFSLATSLGICALALDLLITTSEADHGLVLASTAIALTGKGGSVLLLTMLFMNPLYLILSFVVYLVSKALWMQQDIGEFFNNPVSALVSVSTRSLLNLMETLQQFFGGEQVHQHTGPPAPSSSLLGSQSFSSQTQFSNPMTSAVAAETLRTHDKCSN